MIARSLVAACLLCCCFIATVAAPKAESLRSTPTRAERPPAASGPIPARSPPRIGRCRSAPGLKSPTRRTAAPSWSASTIAVHSFAGRVIDLTPAAAQPARIWRACPRLGQLDVTLGQRVADQRGWSGASTCVQPGRPISTQSWSLRICAMTSAIQMPVTTSMTVTANPSAFIVMRWRKSSGSSGASFEFFEVRHRRRARRVSRKHRAARTKRQDSTFGFA